MKPLLHHIVDHRTRYSYLSAIAVLLFIALGLANHNQTIQNQVRELTRDLTLARAMTSDSCRARDSWAANTSKAFTVQSGDAQRTYLVHLPANFDTTKHYPVVLAFAGRGGHADGFSKQIDISTWNAITVFPQALVGQGGATAWQGAPYSVDSDDIALVDTILNSLESQLCVQRSHIFSAGFSNGGGFAWQLACTRSDRIAAVAMVAGAFYPQAKQTCAGDRPVAMLNIHGDNDQVVPYSGSIHRKLPNIDIWSAEQAARNGCATTPLIQRYGSQTTVTTWSACTDNATVQNIRLHGTHHTWPTLIDLPQAKKAHTPSETASIIWRFFMNHPF